MCVLDSVSLVLNRHLVHKTPYTQMSCRLMLQLLVLAQVRGTSSTLALLLAMLNGPSHNAMGRMQSSVTILAIQA